MVVGPDASVGHLSWDVPVVCRGGALWLARRDRLDACLARGGVCVGRQVADSSPGARASVAVRIAEDHPWVLPLSWEGWAGAREVDVELEVQYRVEAVTVEPEPSSLPLSS